MGKKVYIETYGCQMNVADSEVVISILEDKGFKHTDDINSAGLILDQHLFYTRKCRTTHLGQA